MLWLQVKDPGTTFPRALGLVMLLVFANYALPIMAFTGLDSDYSKYHNGYYISVRQLGVPSEGAFVGF